LLRDYSHLKKSLRLFSPNYFTCKIRAPYEISILKPIFKMQYTIQNGGREWDMTGEICFIPCLNVRFGERGMRAPYPTNPFPMEGVGYVWLGYDVIWCEVMKISSAYK
jgi:hypothetical protein